MNQPNDGDLCVWWIGQIGTKAFRWPVKSPEEGALLLDAFAAYDLHQLAQNIRGDFSNAGGLVQYSHADIENDDPETGWTDWYDERTGDDIREWSDRRAMA